MRHICKMETLEIRVVIKYFCKTECLPRKFMKTSWKPLGRSLHSTVKKWAAAFKRGREGIEGDGRSGRPQDATADENVKVVHTLVMGDRRPDL